MLRRVVLHYAYATERRLHEHLEKMPRRFNMLPAVMTFSYGRLACFSQVD